MPQAKQENDLTQEELLIRVARRSGVKRDDVRLVLRALYDEIARTLSLGGRIRITNFGSFTAPLKTTRNPRTGAYGPEKRFAHWTPTGLLRDVVAGSVAPGTLKKRNPPRSYIN